MSDGFTVYTQAVPIVASSANKITVSAGAGGTLYYKNSPSVSANSNDGSLVTGQSITFSSKQWLVSASRTSVFTTSSNEGDQASQQELNAAVAGISNGDSLAVYNVVNFGADPTGATYSDSAFADALAAIDLLYLQGIGELVNAGAMLWIPFGTYALSENIRIHRELTICGVSGAGFGSGTRLIFDDGVAGITVEYDTTSDGLGNGSWTVIRDLAVKAAAKTIPGADGIRLHGRAKVENVYVNGFSRDGVNIDMEELGGNANNWRLDYLRIDGNGRHGLLVRGNDANAGLATGVDSSQNGAWGIYDSSFLGNTYIACHTSANGYLGASTTLNGGINNSTATITLADASGANADGGAIQIGTEQISYTGVSGSDLTGCARGFNVTTPASHLNGATVSYESGGYRTDGAVNLSTFVSCYTESAQGTCNMITAPSTVFGGIGDGGTGSTAPTFEQNQGLAQVVPGLRSTSGTITDADSYVQIGGGTAAEPGGAILAHVGDGSYYARWTGGNLAFLHDNSGARQAMLLTGDASSLPPGNIAFPNGIYLANAGTQSIANGASAPGSGAHLQGEIVINNAPTAGGTIGWVCTTAGSPGTWKTFGAISA